MLSINLTSYSDAFKTLEEAQFKRYLDYFGIQVKVQESEDIYKFVETIRGIGLFADQLNDVFANVIVDHVEVL